MNIVATEENNKVILKVNGEIDLYNAPELREALTELLDKNNTNILIDLNDVDYIDSSGIGVLISSATDIKDAGGSLVLKCSSPNVIRVFELTRLIDFFNIVD